MAVSSYRDDLGQVIEPDDEATIEESRIRSSGMVSRLPPPGKLPAEAATFLRATAPVKPKQAAVARLAKREAAKRTSPAADAFAFVPVVAAKKAASDTVLMRFAQYDVLGRIDISLARGSAHTNTSGHAGLTELYLARETLPNGTHRKIALRVWKPEAPDAQQARRQKAEFVRDARHAVQVAQPNVAQVYGHGQRGQLRYLASEWVDGRSLREILLQLRESGRLLPPVFVANIVAQAAYALDGAHCARDARGHYLDLVHGHVNPQNILIRYDGAVKVTGFGLSHLRAGTNFSAEQPVDERLCYLAPEQLGTDGPHRKIDPRTDVFALGICLYEMLTGIRVHKRSSARGTANAVLGECAASLRVSVPELPEAIDAIVLKALEKRPEHRFQNAAELASALEAFLASQGAHVSLNKVARLMDKLYPDPATRLPRPDTDEVALRSLREAQNSSFIESVRPTVSKRMLLATSVCAAVVGALAAWWW